MYTSSKRALAPDLARGVMLLLIALAHAHLFMRGHPGTHRHYATDGSTLDLAVAGVQMTLVDGRALPLFALLFGYGLVQVASKQATKSAARWVLIKRCFWMIVFGGLHAHYLFEGDILGTYGVAGLLLIGTLAWRNHSLLVLAGVWLVVHCSWILLGAFRIIRLEGTVPNGLPAWALHSVTWPVTVMLPMILGIWAARRRMLIEPQQHVRFLRNAAIAGLGVMVAGSLPLALVVAQVDVDVPMRAAIIAHTVTGLAGGIGYSALIGLIAARVKKPGPVMYALAATGERSLTNYVLQSVSWLVLFTLGGLGYVVNTAGASLIAVLTWLTTVVLSVGLSLAGLPGPLEKLLRFLTYGRRKSKPPQPQAQPARAMAEQTN